MLPADIPLGASCVSQRQIDMEPYFGMGRSSEQLPKQAALNRNNAVEQLPRMQMRLSL